MRERTNTKALVTGGLMAALQIVLLRLTYTMPTMQLTLLAMAGILNAVVLIEGSITHAVLVYAAASVFSLLFAPDSFLLYLLFFGHYPIVKYLLERIGKNWPRRLAKLVFANACLAVYVLIVQLFVRVPLEYALPLIWLVYNAVFVLYDIALTRLLVFYQYKIRPRIFAGR